MIPADPYGNQFSGPAYDVANLPAPMNAFRTAGGGTYRPLFSTRGHRANIARAKAREAEELNWPPEGRRLRGG